MKHIVRVERKRKGQLSTLMELTQLHCCTFCLTCELTVVIGTCRVFLVGAQGRAGRGTGAEAGVAQR